MLYTAKKEVGGGRIAFFLNARMGEERIEAGKEK
jgi:hypothetical protein